MKILRGVLLPLACIALCPTPARAQAPAAQEWFSIVLSTSASTTQRPAVALPASLKANTVYWRALRTGNAASSYQLCLGFFTTRNQADQARHQLAASYRGAQVIPVTARERDDVLKALAPRPGATPAPQLAAAPAPAGREAELMTQGRSAVVREDYPAAIRAFSAILAMPENAQSRDAREFLGLAYERSGDAARAKAEYETYLKRYPEGDDAQRVRQRLADLRPAPPAAAPLRAPAQPQQGWRSFTFGSLSQFYYRGKSAIDSQTLQPATNTFDRTTLSLTDQSALITNVNLNARYLDETHDNRLVFRDTNTHNYVEGQNNRNRLSAAYYDYRYKPADFSLRVGRQPYASGGVLGRFDGAVVGSGLTPRFRLNVVGGEPADVGLQFDTKRRFYGVNTDLGPYAERWSGNLYFIRQTADGIVDRQATGTELRYIAPQGSIILQVDYDTVFHATNIAMLQGNWQTQSKTSYNFLIDRRKTPTLQTTTATFGEASTSIQTLLATYTEEQLRQRAKALTATASTASAGVMHPVGKVWQLGIDYRLMRVSATEGTNNFPASADTGDVRTSTVQGIGTGVFAKRDVTVASASRILAQTYHGTAWALNERAPVSQNWTLGGSLLWYQQGSDGGITLRRFYGTMRAEYQWRRNVSFETEVGLETTRSESPFANEKVDRRFLSLGYRWDF